MKNAVAQDFNLNNYLADKVLRIASVLYWLLARLRTYVTVINTVVLIPKNDKVLSQTPQIL